MENHLQCEWPIAQLALVKAAIRELMDKIMEHSGAAMVLLFANAAILVYVVCLVFGGADWHSGKPGDE